MYSFIINPSKIKSIEISTDTTISNAKLVEGDHNSCYFFKSYINHIIFTDGTRYDRPDIDIEYLYIDSKFRRHYFKLLEAHYEQGKSIPYYVEHSIAPSLYSLEKDVCDITKIDQYRMSWTFYNKKDFASHKIKYSI